MTNKIKARYHNSFWQMLAVVFLGLLFATNANSDITALIAITLTSVIGFGHLWLRFLADGRETELEMQRIDAEAISSRNTILAAALEHGLRVFRETFQKMDSAPVMPFPCGCNKTSENEMVRLQKLFSFLMPTPLGELLSGLTSDRLEQLRSNGMRRLEALKILFPTGVPSEVLAEAALALLLEQAEFTEYFRPLSGNDELEVKCSEWAEVMDAPSVAAAS